MPEQSIESLRPSAVIKLGGSLLDLPDLVTRLEELSVHWGPRPLLVVGGGEAADLVRAWDQRFQIGEQRSHWLALDSLELTARLLTTLWPRSSVARIDQMAETWQQSRKPIISPREWFERAAANLLPSPPQTWDTTTDTIAAWVAGLCQASELWLLKSVDAPQSLSEATDAGQVDAHFSHWIKTPVKWVNLRLIPSATSHGERFASLQMDT